MNVLRRSPNARVPLGLAVAGAALLAVTSVSGAAPQAGSDALVRSLREQARKVNGFVAQMSVRAGGSSQSGSLLFLAPDRVHMEMKVVGLGEQKIVSDGRTLWTITPQARLATKVDLEKIQRSWKRPLPNQATAIRDVFDVVKAGSVRYVKDEAVQGVKTRLFEAVPEIGVEARKGAELPDKVRMWVGEDGLLRRQVLLKGDEVLMDATFRITDKNPRIQAGMFRFDPPAGYEVQDLTDSTLQTLRQLESGQAAGV